MYDLLLNADGDQTVIRVKRGELDQVLSECRTGGVTWTVLNKPGMWTN
jgi:hypothetical protein